MESKKNMLQMNLLQNSPTDNKINYLQIIIYTEESKKLL